MVWMKLCIWIWARAVSLSLSLSPSLIMKNAVKIVEMHGLQSPVLFQLVERNWVRCMTSQR